MFLEEKKPNNQTNLPKHQLFLILPVVSQIFLFAV